MPSNEINYVRGVTFFFFKSLGWVGVDKNEITHYQIIIEKATLLQCFWINIQVTFEQNKAHFRLPHPKHHAEKEVF